MATTKKTIQNVPIVNNWNSNAKFEEKLKFLEEFFGDSLKEITFWTSKIVKFTIYQIDTWFIL